MEQQSPKVLAASSCCGVPSNNAAVAWWQPAMAYWRSVDKPIALILAITLFVAIGWPGQLQPTLLFTRDALLHIAPWIAVSVTLAAYAQASRADQLVASALGSKPRGMVMVAALVGAASPFCSCGVVPIVAGLLRAGVPIAPIMAFWISSPLMDPTMFVLTAASLGMEFAIVKTIAAVAMGWFAGAITHGMVERGLITNLLRDVPPKSCCGSPKPSHLSLQWKVWQSNAARSDFAKSVASNAWFLGRWMVIAFLLESLMVAYLPGEKVTAWLGQGVAAIPLAVAIGIPSYLNGFAALPLVSGLISLGMHPAVALAFLVAGGVTSVPAMAAVWGLVKPRGFALYLGLALSGSIGVAYAYAAWLGVRAGV